MDVSLSSYNHIILELIDWLISYIEAEDKHDLIHWFIVFNATFSNIAAISWRPVLVVEEAGVSGENHEHGQATVKLDHLR
jgi:hypothetical protein